MFDQVIVAVTLTGNAFSVRSLGRATTRIIMLHPARNTGRSCCYAAIRRARFWLSLSPSRISWLTV
jgi:hypothetical protein